ncbi:PTS glucose transporter subunit IIA [Leuconostoc mesenteroides]|uniref:PTS glucose transporter subunit IIA n=1 Tax=Leuconostoc mesenteroides TaxID=1245 RepID=UPI0023604104|nr:PTS glucose transporter subunit IIA [Leuconostoc mesenteroides]
MNFWKRLFGSEKKLSQLKSTGQINATRLARNNDTPVLVAPVTGDLQKITDSRDEPFKTKNGVMLVPHGGNLMAPVSGIVTESTNDYLTLTDISEKTVTVTVVGTSNVVRLAQYGVGQQLHAGDVIGTTNQKVLSADHEALRIYVVWANQDLPNIRYGSVYAGQNVWQVGELQNDKESDS